MKILQVVRTFSPHGGQERYVWELSHALARAGHQLEIFCIHCPKEPDVSTIRIHLSPIAFEKPRWLHALLFERHTSRFISEQRQPFDIVHSHERTRGKDCVTLHGPPFAHTRKDPFYKKCSLRYWMNHRLERWQVLGKTTLICVSETLRQRILSDYPQIVPATCMVVTPGASIPKNPGQRTVHTSPTLGFMGREWKRKGLARALDSWKSLRQEIPELAFLSAGFPSREHPLGQALPEGCTHYDWVDDAEDFFDKIDVLVHPARDEPFGMVILEALSRGIPVVISERCGARSLVNESNGRIQKMNTETSAWSKAIKQALTLPPFTPLSRDWNSVAEEYLRIYSDVLDKKYS